MRLDKQNLLADAQAITAATTAFCTNAVDLQGLATPGANQTTAYSTDTLGNTPVDDAGRSALTLLVQVVETFVGGTSVLFEVVNSANADLSSPTVIHSTPAILTAVLKAGYQFRVALPPGLAARYAGVRYTSVGVHSAGKFTAAIVPEGLKQTNPSVG